MRDASLVTGQETITSSPHIGVHRPAMIGDRFVDIEEEAGDQVMHLELAHFLGEPRRAGDVEEHHDQLFADRTTMTVPRTTLVSTGPPISRPISVSAPKHERYGKADRHDPRQG